jgi:hypothetical protein
VSPYRENAAPRIPPRTLPRATVAGACLATYACAAAAWLTFLEGVLYRWRFDELREFIPWAAVDQVPLLALGVAALLCAAGGAPRTRARWAAAAALLNGVLAVASSAWVLPIGAWLGLGWLAIELGRVHRAPLRPAVTAMGFGLLMPSAPLRVVGFVLLFVAFFFLAKAARRRDRLGGTSR